VSDEENTRYRIEKPWGWEEIWAQSDKYVGKILSLKSGHRLSRQYHQVKDETIYVQNGNLHLEIGDDEIEIKILSPGASYRIRPGTVHRFAAPPSRMPVTLFEISTPELSDVIRLEDDYERA